MKLYEKILLYFICITIATIVENITGINHNLLGISYLSIVIYKVTYMLFGAVIFKLIKQRDI